MCGGRSAWLEHRCNDAGRQGNEKRADLLAQERPGGSDNKIFSYRPNGVRLSVIDATQDPDISTATIIPEDFDFDLIVRSVLSGYFLVSCPVDGLREETVGTSLETFEFILQEFASNRVLHLRCTP